MAKKRTRVSNLLIIALVIVVVLALIILMGALMPKPQEVLQGEAETTDYRLSSKVPGRVKELRVQAGDKVKAGDTLAILEAPEVEAKMAQARAAESAAQAIELKAQNGARQQEIQGAYELWQKAKAGLDVAEKTFARVERLFNEGVIAAQKRDEAQAQLQAMQATERAAKSQYEMAREGARREDKAAAQAQVARAQGAIQEVNAYMAETVLTATADGTVTEVFPEIGELVGTGAPIMNVAMDADVKFIFNVREDYLSDLKVGSNLRVYLPALDREIDVKIARIAVMGSYSTWKATKALDQYDLKTFEVEARPAKASDVKDVIAGMTAIIKK
ncbi:MAG: HlyD family efflux transporter periplasmic adaptor subunit [Bacteroidaceae bacterium]|nr:HlyD family efflux transporter periplasmic adaptor subunit [Bacteroidaceae bacterium]